MTGGPLVQRKPLRRSDLFARRAGNENALFDGRTGEVHLLNETAWAIYDLCDGATTLDEMIEAVCELSRMHRDVVAEDIERIIGAFEEAGIVTWAD